jgi:HD-like signal output (HDOD) protein
MDVIDKREIEREILSLRPLSESARAILDLLGRSDHSLHDLIAVVECDGPLTIRVLNIVNSAIFALPMKIEAISHAIVYLGEKAVVSIALSCSASELFGEDPSDFTAGLWEDAVQTAIAARLIAGSEARGVDPASAFTGGLIRDVGQSVLWRLLKDEASGLELCIASGRASELCSAERELTGTDHCEVGVRVGEHFELPPSLISLIRDHHEPERADPEIQGLVDVIHVAEAVTRAMRFPQEGSEEEPDAEPGDAELQLELDERCAARIGFALSDLGGLCAALEDEFEISRALVSIRH